jgi:hypothetical protein
MKIVPILKLHTDNLNCSLNPLNVSLDYEVFIDELNLGKDMCMGGFYINATDTKKKTEVLGLPGRQYVVIYKNNNSEYFLKIGYLFKLSNFLEYVRILFCQKARFAIYLSVQCNFS